MSVDAVSSISSVQECKTCGFHYDSRVRAPMIVCQQQHLFCQFCCECNLEGQGKACPDCQKPIDQIQFAKFRLYPNFEARKREHSLTHKQKVSQTKLRLLPIMAQVIDILAMGQKKEELPEFLRKMAVDRAKNSQFSEAIIMLQKLIQGDPAAAMAETCIGLGCTAAQVGFSEEEGIEWHMGRGEVSLFDQLAFCLAREGDCEMAARYYNGVMLSCEVHAGCHQVVFGAAVSEHNAGRIDSALQLYAKVTTIKPEFAQPYALMALIHLSRGESKEACLKAQQCLSRDCRNVLGQFVEAVSCDPSNFETVERKLSLLITAEPRFVRAINFLGEAYLQEGCIMKAREELQRCLDINKAFVEPMVNLGKVLLRQEQYDQAIRILIQATRKDPSTERTCFFLLGIAYNSQKLHRAALRYFHAYLDLTVPDASTDVTVYPRMAESHWGLTDYRMAANMARSFLEKATPDAEERWGMHKLMAEAFAALKDSVSVGECWKKWEMEFPDDPSAHLCQGQLQLGMGQFQQAIMHFQHCLKAEHQLPLAYAGMIEACSSLGQKERAVELSQQYISTCELTTEEIAKLPLGAISKKCDPTLDQSHQ